MVGAEQPHGDEAQVKAQLETVLGEETCRKFERQLESIISGFTCERLYHTILNPKSFEFGQFTTNLTGLVQSDHELFEKMDNMIANADINPSIRFFAFYIMLAFWRKYGSYDSLKNHYDKHRGRFQGEEVMDFVKGMVLKMSDDRLEMADGIRSLHRWAHEENPHAGFWQAYADGMALYREKGFDYSTIGGDFTIEDAISCIEHAIEEKPQYATYYFTRSRLRLLHGEYEPATTDIQHAVRHLNPFSPDHGLAMMEYTTHLLRIRTCRDIGTLRAESANVRESIEEAKSDVSRSIEESTSKSYAFLGFLSVLVVLAVGSTSLISSDLTFLDAMLTLLVLGALLLTLAELLFRHLHGAECNCWHYWPFLLSLLLVLLSVGVYVILRTSYPAFWQTDT